MAKSIETGADADAAEVPAVFVAVAVTVYTVPFVRPVTGQYPGATVAVHVPTATPAVVYAVTVYDVGVTPVPAVMVAVTLPSPATTDTVGVPGAVAVAVAVTTEADGPDASEGPFAFVAITVKV
jgi:hypothetical protein